jgi:hypothetical protein
MTKFDLIKRNFWTKSSSSGKLVPVQPAVPPAAVWVFQTKHFKALAVQEEATPPGEIPSGGTRVKLEPDR